MGERGGGAPEHPNSRGAEGPRLADLVAELQDPGGEVRPADERFRVLLDAVLAVGTGLSLPDVLRVIVEGACRVGRGPLRRARCDRSRRAALGVHHRRHRRRDPRAHRRRAAEGAGSSACSSRDPRPLMLRDLDRAPGFGRLPAEPSADALVPRCPGAGPRVGVRQPLPVREAGWRRVHRDRSVRSSPRSRSRPASRSRTRTLYTEHRRREEWLDAIAEISRDLLAGAEIDSVLQDIAVRAGPIARADAVRVMLLDDDRRALQIVAAHGDACRGDDRDCAVPIGGHRRRRCLPAPVRPRSSSTPASDPRVFLPRDRGACGPARSSTRRCGAPTGSSACCRSTTRRGADRSIRSTSR